MVEAYAEENIDDANNACSFGLERHLEARRGNLIRFWMTKARKRMKDSGRLG